MPKTIKEVAEGSGFTTRQIRDAIRYRQIGILVRGVAGVSDDDAEELIKNLDPKKSSKAALVSIEFLSKQLVGRFLM